jgi:pyridoxal phosphate enzyme (YggS family)
MKVDVGAPPTGAPSLLEGRIAAVRAQVADACRTVGRDPAAVRVVGVTKAQPITCVLAAIAAGIDEIGENYVQEARAKFARLPPVRTHFIGHVQTNKAKAIVETFDVVQSIDRLDAGLAIARAARSAGRAPTTLVQVNVSPTERFGVAPAEAALLAARLRDEGLEVDGVMAIGPNTDDRGAIRRAFGEAAQAFEKVGGSTLSIGMSNDWREAVAAGSTMLRLGSALFGARG